MKLRNKKTGEIGKLWYETINLNFGDHNEVYHSLAELNADWEDYAPDEPLIKDEKIRKAVRAWADANNSTEMVFDGYHIASDEYGNDIEFSVIWGNNIEHGKYYTIAELCGE